MKDTWLDFWEPNRAHLYYKHGNCEIWSFTWMTTPVVADVYESNCYWMCTFCEGGPYGMIWLTGTSDGDTSTGSNWEIVTGGQWLIETWITGVRHYKLVCLLRMSSTCWNSCKVCNLLVFYLNWCEHWTKITCSSTISFICFFFVSWATTTEAAINGLRILRRCLFRIEHSKIGWSISWMSESALLIGWVTCSVIVCMIRSISYWQQKKV
jgi:hypothetical protein